MNVYRLLTSRRARNALRTKRFMAAAPDHMDLCGIVFDQSIIATVAFNRSDVIEWQIHLIRKYLAERDSYIVFDNSSLREERTAIRELCRRKKIPYVGLPKNVFKESHSHGHALNWITAHFVAPRELELFGFLDHDIFPVTPFSVAEKIAGKKVYGWRHSRQGAWYLWAGFCFFSGVQSTDLDFRPISEYGYLDTGGANWDALYGQLQESDVQLVDVREIPVPESGSFFQDFDGWLHAINASRWNKNAPYNRGRALTKRLRDAGGPNSPAIDLEYI